MGELQALRKVAHKLTLKKTEDILTDVAQYYSEKLVLHGETPQGVDWNGEESQTLRFEQLYKIVKTTNHFSINDIGCGYGAFYDFLTHKHESFSYCGIDVSESMIHAAEQRYKKLMENQPEILQNVPIQYIASFLGMKPESLSRIRKQMSKS